jgi:hypothetical protein
LFKEPGPPQDAAGYNFDWKMAMPRRQSLRSFIYYSAFSAVIIAAGEQTQKHFPEFLAAAADALCPWKLATSVTRLLFRSVSWFDSQITRQNRLSGESRQL